MANTSDDRRACPVCTERAIAAAEKCPVCGWTLTTRARPGFAPAAVAAAFKADLKQAYRVHDVRAAERAAAVAGPKPLAGLARLLPFVRGGPGSEAGLPVRGEPATPPALDGLSAALRGTDAHTALSYLVVDPSGLALLTAGSGPLQVAFTGDWTDLCPQLSGDRDRRLFQLAGGIGTKPVDRTEWNLAVADALSRIPAPAGGPLILVDPPRGWTLLEHAARLARARFGPAAILPAQGGLQELTDRLRRVLPRPEGYDVLLGRPDPATGSVQARRVPVFPPAVVDDPRQAEIVVHGAAHGGEVLVPLLRHGLADDDPAADAGAMLLALSPGERTVITARQESPGTVQLTHPRARPSAPAWAGLASSLTLLLRTERDDPVDVVVTVELGQPIAHPGLAAARRDAAAALVERLASLTDGRRSLRTGVIGYGDHQRRWPAELTVQPLGPHGDAVARLAAMGPAEVVNDLVAPLEDALHAATAMSWRPAARKLLIAVAGRPPHPPQERQYQPACPSGHRFDVVVDALPAGLEVLPLLIGRPASPSGADGGWADQAWARLSPLPAISGLAQCVELLEDLLVPGGPAQHLRLALSAPPTL